MEVGHCPSRDTFPILSIRIQIPSHQEVLFWQEVEQIYLQIKPSAPCQDPKQSQASLISRPEDSESFAAIFLLSSSPGHHLSLLTPHTFFSDPIPNSGVIISLQHSSEKLGLGGCGF
jgi:hypothetical protein